MTQVFLNRNQGAPDGVTIKVLSTDQDDSAYLEIVVNAREDGIADSPPRQRCYCRLDVGDEISFVVSD